MNLLDNASLVVTPNGYKASKLYSIVPTSGTGDMTFSRAGNTATRVNPSGVIESVNANIPRLDYLGSTCPKVLLEPQRTNLILQSQDISAAAWAKTNSPTIVSNVAVAPDGTTTADSIQATDGTNFKYIQQTLSITPNSTQTISVFVKKEISKTNFGGFGIFYLGTSTKNLYVAFDEVNGTIKSLTGTISTPTYKVDDYGTYWRFQITVIELFSNTSLSVEIYSTISVNNTSTGAGAGSARTIWGMQVEAGTFASSYIPTTTATVTRNADACSKTSISSLIGQTEGVVFFDVNLDSRLSFTYLFIRNTATSNYIGFIISTIIGLQIVNSSVTQASITFGNSNTGRFKIAVAYKENDIAFYANGSLIGTDTVATIPTCDILDLNYNPANGIRINTSALWKTRLTNSELATLTTL